MEYSYCILIYLIAFVVFIEPVTAFVFDSNDCHLISNVCSSTNNNELPYILWSDINSWISLTFPTTGDNVIIGPNTWLILDVSPPKLSSLIIYGRLSVLQNSSAHKDIILTSSYIKVIGDFEIINDEGDTDVTVILDDSESNISNYSSKAIDVYGTFKAIGRNTTKSYVQLLNTAYRGQTSLYLNYNDSPALNWKVGDTIVLSPTSFYTEEGSAWYSSVQGFKSPVELRKIVVISDNVITIDQPLDHTHLCEISYNETFCGYVGLMTRSITVKAPDDTLDSTSTNYASGGRVSLITGYETTAHLNLTNVNFVNMGRAVDQYGAINLNNNPLNDNITTTVVVYISHCSFASSFNVAIHCNSNKVLDSSKYLSISDNVFYKSWGGAVTVQYNCNHYRVVRNLAAGILPVPMEFRETSVMYAFNSPISAFSLYSNNGLFEGNKVAGSYENGFAIRQSYFLQKSIELNYPAGVCQTTFSSSINKTYIQQLTKLRSLEGKLELENEVRII